MPYKYFAFFNGVTRLEDKEAFEKKFIDHITWHLWKHNRLKNSSGTQKCMHIMQY